MAIKLAVIGASGVAGRALLDRAAGQRAGLGACVK